MIVKTLMVLSIALATSTLMPAIALGQIVLNSDIWYDDVSNTVYGYTEAYTTYDLGFYYTAQLSGMLYANGETLDGDSVTTSGTYAIALVSVPAEPDTDYAIWGYLSGCMYYYQIVYPDPYYYYYCYYDFYNYAYRVQYDPCYDFRSVSCHGPGPPTWIPMVACATIAVVWNEIHVPPPKYFQATGSDQKNPCDPGEGSGVGAVVHYQVLNNNGSAMHVAGITPQEHVKVNGQDTFQGFLPFASPSSTTASGTFNDDPVGSCFLNVPPGLNPCVDVVQTFNAVLNNATYSVQTTVTRRDCLNGIRIEVTGNPAGKNYSVTYGNIN